MQITITKPKLKCCGNGSAQFASVRRFRRAPLMQSRLAITNACNLLTATQLITNSSSHLCDNIATPLLKRICKYVYYTQSITHTHMCKLIMLCNSSNMATCGIVKAEIRNNINHKSRDCNKDTPQTYAHTIHTYICQYTTLAFVARSSWHCTTSHLQVARLLTGSDQ